MRDDRQPLAEPHADVARGVGRRVKSEDGCER